MTEPEQRLLVIDLNAGAPQWSLPAHWADQLREAAPPGWTIRVVRSRTVSDGDGARKPSAEAKSEIRLAEAYIGFGISAELLEAGERLRWVHSAAAGVGALPANMLLRRGVVVTNSAGIYAEPIAEYVVAGVLWLLRGLDISLEAKREKRWDKEPFDGANSPLREMRDVRALIVGTGGIGRAIASRLARLGAVCTGVRRRPELGIPDGFASAFGPESLDSLLPQHDLLVLAAPATNETHSLVTPERLDRLPRDAIVANVARGALLAEGALAERIARGRLRGAVLDVFENEPLSPNSPLWTLPSVMITPHIAGVSPGNYWPRQVELLLDNWRRFAAGESLRNLVDLTAGY